MHVAVIGTYPPTRCGIATFTADVEHALTEVGVRVSVIVVDPDPSQVTAHPAGDLPTIVSGDRSSYRSAARWLNESDVDLVLVEHEFGIHGGVDGAHVLDLTEHLQIPYVVTLHTVLTRFTATQSAILQTLCGHAAGITLFTATARQMVLEQEFARSSALTVVPHGAPVELYRPTGRSLRTELGLGDDDAIVSTFGLLSPGKGIEIAIAAMRQIATEMPHVRYVIAGRTHPGVQRTAGEQYRAELQTLVASLGLDEHVRFVDRFLTVDEIAELLSVTKVFLTPYRNADQIVSGALTFAIAAGCPVVSTPYRYGVDMVGHGAGMVVPFDDPDAFAAATLALLTDGPQRASALGTAAAVSATLSWPAVGRMLQQVLQAARERVPAAPTAPTAPDTLATPNLLADAPRPTPPLGAAATAEVTPSTAHLLVLLDDTSVMQHAAHRLPRLEEGYCVDDTARLLPIAARLLGTGVGTSVGVGAADDGDPDGWRSAMSRLLRYLRAAARDGDGLMRNFMSWERQWLDQPHDGDHVGRAVWGLGELVQHGVFVEEATHLLQPLIDRPMQQAWPRLVAYRSLGLLAARGQVRAEQALDEVYALVQQWRPIAPADGWNWPEARVVYDAARLPEVMIRLGALRDDRGLVERGLGHLVWLERQCREGEHYRFPGHLGLGPDDDLHDSGDEQPLEAAAMIDAAAAAFEITGEPWAATVAERAWTWFLGNNRQCRPVGVLQSGACHDALTAHGVNQNCGAESTIAFHRAAHAVARLRRLSERAGTCSNATPTTL